MASYNRVILVGNLTRDVELRYTQSGLAVTDIGLAINDRRKNQAGDWVEEATFVDVTFWGRTAEVAGEYLSKGSSVLIEGRLKLDTWETDGQKRSKLHVVCERMQMLGGKQGGSSGGGHSPSQQPNRQAAAPAHDNSAPPSGNQGPPSGNQGPPSGNQGPPSGNQGPPSGNQGPTGPPEDEIPF